MPHRQVASGRARIDVRGLAYVVATLLGWSSVLLFLRALHEDIDAWAANGWRYGLCALLFLPFQLSLTLRGRSSPGVWRKAVVPTIFNSLGQICFGFSIYYIKPGLAGFLLRVSLITSTAGALTLFADERRLARSGLFWLGLGCVAIGSLVTIFLSDTPIAGGQLTGVLMGAGAGAFFGLYGVAVRANMRHVSSMQSFSTICTLTAAAMVACMLAFGKESGAPVLSLSPLHLFYLVASALIGIAMGHLFYYASIKRLGVAVAGAIVQIAPFITASFSHVLFNESLTAWQWAGGAIMLTGGYALLRAEQTRPREVVENDGAFAVVVEDAGDPVVSSALLAESRPQSPDSADRSDLVEGSGKSG